jgi:hypothetical protein
VGQLLEVYSILERVIGGVAVCNVDGDVIIVTVGQVDVAAVVPWWWWWCSCGTGTCGHLVFRAAVVNLNPNVVSITQAVVKPFATIHGYPTTSSQPVSPYISTIFESLCLDPLHRVIVAELVWSRKRNLVP